MVRDARHLQSALDDAALGLVSTWCQTSGTDTQPMATDLPAHRLGTRCLILTHSLCGDAVDVKDLATAVTERDAQPLEGTLSVTIASTYAFATQRPVPAYGITPVIVSSFAVAVTRCWFSLY